LRLQGSILAGVGGQLCSISLPRLKIPNRRREIE
jgi:hypothetical protein